MSRPGSPKAKVAAIRQANYIIDHLEKPMMPKEFNGLDKLVASRVRKFQIVKFSPEHIIRIAARRV